MSRDWRLCENNGKAIVAAEPAPAEPAPAPAELALDIAAEPYLAPPVAEVPHAPELPEPAPLVGPEEPPYPAILEGGRLNRNTFFSGAVYYERHMSKLQTQNFLVCSRGWHYQYY